jgi:hypothetical protein
MGHPTERAHQSDRVHISARMNIEKDTPFKLPAQAGRIVIQAKFECVHIGLEVASLIQSVSR